MKCQNCGHENDMEETFCEKCSTNLIGKRQSIFRRIPGNIGCRCGTSYGH
ncbi:MAG: zinc-ribbon domain-containing protein [Methanobacterium sp.]